MNHKKILSTLVFSLCSICSWSQNFYYAVYFKDKGDNVKLNISDCISDNAYQKRLKNNIDVDFSDFPISSDYVNRVSSPTSKVLLQSRWLNCIVIKSEIPMDFSDYQFVTKVIPINKSDDEITCRKNEHENTMYHNEEIITNGNSDQLDFINVTPLHDYGYYGQNVTIAIMDDGFLRANQVEQLNHIFEENRVVCAKNFIDSKSIYNVGSGHGSRILSILAAESSNFTGSSPRANYMLFRTEDVDNESLIEEYAWVSAAEYADSVGVDIISSSLNYSIMDDSSQSHTYSDMDGKTCPISVGAQIAASKGIIVVNSAGNDGASEWKYISAPADANGVVTVGGANTQGEKWYASSVGPTADGRIKPEICGLAVNVVSINPLNGNTISGNGTSFATPVISGSYACLMSAFPDISSSVIKDVVLNTSSNALTMNNEIGKGIPDFAQAYNVVGVADNELSKSPYKVYPNPFVSDFNISHHDDITSIIVFTANGKALPTKTNFEDYTIVNIEVKSSYKGLVYIIVETKDNDNIKLVAIKK